MAKGLFLFLFLLSFSTISHASNTPHNQILINDATPKQVIDAVAQTILARVPNATVVNATDYSMVISISIPSSGSQQVFAGIARFDRYLSFTAAPAGKNTFLSCVQSETAYSVHGLRPISTKQLMDQNSQRDSRDLIEAVRASLNGYWRYGLTFGEKKNQKGFSVIRVEYDSPAQTNNIKFGDILVAVNNESTSKLKYGDLLSRLGEISEPGSITLKFKNETTEYEVSLEKEFIEPTIKN